MQQKYSVKEIELLAIVETLKEFNGMLWGQQIKVYIDHKNVVQDVLGLTVSSGGDYSWKSMALKLFISKVFITQLQMLSCI